MHPDHPMKPFALPDDWTPEQAMAVVDLLDELRCHIWNKYQIPLHERYFELYGPAQLDKPFRDDPADF